MGRRLSLLAATALTAAVLASATPASAYHSWVNYHWPRSANPFTLTYSSSVSGPWPALVTKVVGEWDNVTQYRAGTFDVVNLATSGTPKLTIESGNYGANGWFGLASITVNLLTGHIASGNVKVNDYYFTGQYNTTAARDHVLCQEVGHIFGLDHNRLPIIFGASCMNDDNATLNSPAYQTPNGHDADHLNLVYTHTDSGTGAAHLGDLLGPIRTIVIDIVPAG